ncbi:hypothetical protein K525DRAFT_251910 [Schizophyllum commune Loenen D]|nr:hypothetical protein K525DRAFT_251910 [Schizophyllum commune Loenen D]
MLGGNLTGLGRFLSSLASTSALPLSLSMTNTNMTGEVHKIMTTAHPEQSLGSSLSDRDVAEGGSAGNGDDDYFDVDPASDQAILGFDLDTPPGPGYCAVPWYPNPGHSAHGRDVRWESSFKSFFLIRSRQSRAGGVYTDKTDMEFALQGLHPPPESQEMSSFFDCLELWKADCRAGACRLPPKARGPSSPLNPATADVRMLQAPPGMLGTPAPVVVPPRSPHTPSARQHGPPPPYPSPTCGPAVARGAPSSSTVFTTPPSAMRPFASAATTSSLASPSAIRSLASVSAASSPASSRPGPEGQRLPSTFIQPVWFSTDSQGVGLILTSSWEYARDLHAKHGNIDVVTDSEKLNAVGRLSIEAFACCLLRSQHDPHRLTTKTTKTGYPNSTADFTLIAPGYRLGPQCPIHSIPSEIHHVYFLKIFNIIFSLEAHGGGLSPTSRAHQCDLILSKHMGDLYRDVACQSVPSPAYTFTHTIMGRRAKAKNDPSKHTPGPTGWVVGTKRAFFDRHQSEFQASTNRGAFYDMITTKFMMKYGAGFDLATDLEEDLPDPDADDMTEDYSDLTQEEEMLARAYRKRLRKKIGQHYRATQNKIKTSDASDAIPKLFTDTAQAQAPRLSVPTHIVQFYSTQYYYSRVKATFDVEFAAAVAEATENLAKWDEMGVDPPPDWKRPQALPIRNRVTAQCWLRETQSFRDAVTRAHQEELERQKSAFTSAMQTPEILETPEDFQRAIATASLYLGPIMNAVNTNTKLCASIFLYGPMPEDGGKLGVLSAHAGLSKGYNPRTLALFDPDGLSEIEGILTVFAKNCYCETSTTALSEPASQLPSTPAPQAMPHPITAAVEMPDVATETPEMHVETPIEAHIETSDSMSGETYDGVSDGMHAETTFDGAHVETTSDGAHAETTSDGAHVETMADSVHIETVEEMPVETPEMSVVDKAAAATTNSASLAASPASPAPATMTGSDALPPLSAPSSCGTPPRFRPLAGTPCEETSDSATTVDEEMMAVDLPATTAKDTSLASPMMPCGATSVHDEQSGAALPVRSTVVDLVDVEKGREEDVWKCKMPAGCPPHIAGIFVACSRGQEWGLAFARAVSAYLALERSLGFPILNHGRLVLAGSIRPPIYRDWIVQKREYSSIVDIGDPREFGGRWRTWWEAMQPPLRISPAGDLLAVEAVIADVTHLAEWGNLEKCCGRDGLVQFLLTLVWWGDAVNDPDRREAYPAQRLEWALAVEDFRDVLEALMAAPDFKRVASKRASGIDYTINMASKHGRDNSDNDKSPATSAKRARTALSERAAGDPAPAKVGRRKKGAASRGKPTNENKAPRPKLPIAPSPAIATASRQSTRTRYVSTTLLRTRD